MEKHAPEGESEERARILLRVGGRGLLGPMKKVPSRHGDVCVRKRKNRCSWGLILRKHERKYKSLSGFPINQEP